MYGLYEGKIKIREDVWQPPLVLNKFDSKLQYSKHLIVEIYLSVDFPVNIDIPLNNLLGF